MATTIRLPASGAASWNSSAKSGRAIVAAVISRRALHCTGQLGHAQFSGPNSVSIVTSR
jgi:hypothetical protein